MTEDHKDRVLAESLEDYHRQRARGERPDLAALAERLGDLYEEFQELVAAETAIDEALAPMPDAPLPLAWGKYTILREIARGAAGVVYEALHRELGRKVALKVLRTGLDTDDTTRERFSREAKALAQVRHDHIVEIFEYGEIEDRPFYAMELVEGPTLADLVKRGERPAPAEVCEGLAGVANALQALHDAGIIHRDVKPSNIMIAPNGRYMLADFGLARTAMSATMTRTGDALGTPLYMSPEQMLGNRDAVDPRTDVYGLGATLYQLLTGRPPFKTDNLQALMRMVLTQRPEAARTIAPDLPPGCSSIAMKCLEKEQRDRYASAGELEAELRACAAGERVLGRPLNLLERTVRRLRRYPAYSAAAVLLLAFGLWMFLRPDPAKLWLEATPARALAEARLDGGPWRDLPFAPRFLEPGREYVVEYRGKGAGFAVDQFVIAPPGRGQIMKYEKRLKVETWTPEVIAAFSESEIPALMHMERTRKAGNGLPIETIFPQGSVRAAQARRWQVTVNDQFLDAFDGKGGYLRFFLDDELIGEAPFPANPERVVLAGDVPPAVVERAAARPGARVVWGFYAHDGEEAICTSWFRIVEVDLARAFASIDALLQKYEDERQIDAATRAEVAANLRGLRLIKQGLGQAAWNELYPRVFDLSDPETGADPSVRPEASLMQVHLLMAAAQTMRPEPSEQEGAWIIQKAREARQHFETEAWERFEGRIGSK